VKVIPEMGTLNAAESRVTVARLSLDQTRKEFERTEALYAKGVVSQEEFEKGQTTLRQAEEEFQNAEDNLEIVKTGITNRYKDLSNTQIRSTITGMILDVPIKVGNSVIQANTGGLPLLDLLLRYHAFGIEGFGAFELLAGLVERETKI